jgi:hypothetical protein
MRYVAFENATWVRIRARNGNESFPTEGVAKRVLNQYLAKKFGADAEIHRELFTVCSLDEWHTAEPMVDTFNLMDPDKKPIKIRMSEKGTCVDPATERYHSM